MSIMNDFIAKTNGCITYRAKTFESTSVTVREVWNIKLLLVDTPWFGDVRRCLL